MAKTMIQWRARQVVLSVIAVSVIGCGPDAPVVEYADVKGSVSYNGEPLKMGTVSFQPDFGARAVGDIQPDGTYSLRGVVGKNTVMIESHEPGAEPGGPEAAKMMHADPVSYIPVKYASLNSGLTAEVKAGEENTIDFHVTE